MTFVIELLVPALVLLMVLLAAVSGWRTGGLMTGARLAGVLGGLVTGLLMARHFVSAALTPVAHLLIGALMVLGFVVIGAVLGRRLGRWAAAAASRSRSRVLDRSAGALVRGALAVVVASLALGVFAEVAPPGWSAVARRGVVADAIAPVRSLAYTAAAPLLRAAPADLAALVPDGNPRLPTTRRVRAVTEAVSGRVLEVLTQRCGSTVQGTGFVAAPHLVVTNAHVVRAQDEVVVRAANRELRATVIAYAATPDLAVLRVPGLRAAPLRLAPADAANGTKAVVVGYPGARYRSTPAAVSQRVPIPDPGGGLPLHEAYRLLAAVRHGNSGSPLLDLRGRVIGVVNALSTTSSLDGYATTLAELHTVLDAHASSRTPVPTGTCEDKEGQK